MESWGWKSDIPPALNIFGTVKNVVYHYTICLIEIQVTEDQ